MMFMGLFTVNHKLIGVVYVVLGSLLGIIGTNMSVVIRVMNSCSAVCVLSSLNENMYGLLITAHGLVMVFLLVMGVLIGGYGNYLVVGLIGCSDVVYPGWNSLSLVVWCLSALALVMGVMVEYGGGAGWTLYPPLVVNMGNVCGGVVLLVCWGLLVNGVGSTLTAANFFSTVMNLRVVGMTLLWVGIMVWCIEVLSVLLLWVLGVLALSLIGVMLDCFGNGSFFDSVMGGDVLLFQHMFWFFGHPEVYILILPAMGLLTMVLGRYSGGILFGGGVMVLAVLGIGGLGMVVWAHHMYITSMDSEVVGYFTVVTMCIGLPTGNKLFNWVCSYWLCNGVVIGSMGNGGVGVMCLWIVVWFVVLFVVGGATGILLGNACVDVECHDGYFVVAHFHIVLSLGAGLGVLCGWILLGFVVVSLGDMIVVMLGFGGGFVVMHWCGGGCMPRRYLDGVVCSWSLVNTLGSVVTGVMLLMLALL